jgi:hypothetical protein
MKLTQKQFNELTGKPSRSKFGNSPTHRVGESGIIKFQSQKEARRYDELMLLVKAGEITDLKLQPQFTLQESYITHEGERIQAIRYTADFSYKKEVVVSPKGHTHPYTTVEDVKGGNATKTAAYKMKKKLMREKFGITIIEI